MKDHPWASFGMSLILNITYVYQCHSPLRALDRAGISEKERANPMVW